LNVPVRSERVGEECGRLSQGGSFNTALTLTVISVRKIRTQECGTPVCDTGISEEHGSDYISNGHRKFLQKVS